MTQKIRDLLGKAKQRIKIRLEKFKGGTKPLVEGKPEFTTQRPVYEVAERTQAIPYGGIGVIHQLPKVLFWLLSPRRTCRWNEAAPRR